MFPTSRPDSLHSGDSLLTESHVSWRAGPWPRCNSQTIPSLDVHHFTRARGTTTDKLFFTFWTYNNVLSISNQHGSESAASTPDTTDKGHISNLWLIPVALETHPCRTHQPQPWHSAENIFVLFVLQEPVAGHICKWCSPWNHCSQLLLCFWINILLDLCKYLTCSVRIQGQTEYTDQIIPCLHVQYSFSFLRLTTARDKLWPEWTQR